MADNLIKEAVSLRRQGLREKALKLLEDYCLENPGDLDMTTTLKVWKKEVVTESWAMSRRDPNRSSCDRDLGEWSRLIGLWSYEFSSLFIQKFLPNIPSPIIANDMVIVPNSNLQSFIGFGVNDGCPLPSTKVLGGRLSYASTPVYIKPFLIFTLNGVLYHISFGKDKLSLNQFISDQRIQLISYCAPMANEEIAVFGFADWILLYKPHTGEARFIPYKLTREDDRLLSPIQWEDEVVFLSRFGQLLRVVFPEDDLDNAKLSMEEINGRIKDMVYSAPCLVKGRLYFESVNSKSSRNICEYSLSRNGSFRTEVLEEGVCSPKDTHLYFSPIAFQEGVIVSSDIESKLYYIQGGYPMRVIPINIELARGSLRVHQTSHIFAFALDNYLIGKVPKGFFCLNLLHSNEGMIEIFRPATDIIAQPISYSHRVFFITKASVKCYATK
ncbi:MAG: hypothetical protein AB1797_14020 [bacterium]